MRKSGRVVEYLEENMAKPLELGMELTGDDARRFHQYMETYEELPPRGRKLILDAVRLTEQKEL